MSSWICAIDLERLPGLLKVPTDYAHALLLLRFRGKPLGWIWLKEGREYTAAQLRQAALDQRGFEIVRETFMQKHVGDIHTSQPFSSISVIICTRDRADYLEQCLSELKKVDYPRYEVIVVDNASATPATSEVAARFGVRYIREGRPGLDWARNRGVQEARHDIVAFLDDDARPDPGWLKAIDRGFADPEVMGVTGLVLPFELQTEAQAYFERVYGGMGKGLSCRRWHRGSMDDRSLLWASGFGVGANMAFRRNLFEAIGLFDVALDVGTATRGGGDVEFLHRTVARGHVLRYEPEASVWHTHRKDFEGLRRQLFNNGCSVIPYLLTCLRNGTVSAESILRYVRREIIYGWYWRRLLHPGRHKRSLILAEIGGFCYGLFMYPVAQRRAKRLAELPQPEGSPSTTVGNVRSIRTT